MKLLFFEPLWQNLEIFTLVYRPSYHIFLATQCLLKFATITTAAYFQLRTIVQVGSVH